MTKNTRVKQKTICLIQELFQYPVEGYRRSSKDPLRCCWRPCNDIAMLYENAGGIFHTHTHPQACMNYDSSLAALTGHTPLLPSPVVSLVTGRICPASARNCSGLNARGNPCAIESSNRYEQPLRGLCLSLSISLRNALP